MPNIYTVVSITRYELTSAKYVNKLPAGKHSVKGKFTNWTISEARRLGGGGGGEKRKEWG